MRTHFPGALHEVRSAARFPLSVVRVWIPDEWPASTTAAGSYGANGKARCLVAAIFLTNSKEDEHMEKRLTTAAGAPVPENQEQERVNRK